jgi:hypothetical protein
MEAYIVILHFFAHGVNASVWPRGPRLAYADKAACERAAAIEARRWSGKWIKPERVACEKLEIAK